MTKFGSSSVNSGDSLILPAVVFTAVVTPCEVPLYQYNPFG
jgi:hypothetical protein